MKAASELGFLESVDAFLRARGTPISVGQLAQQVPRPADLTKKFITVLASDARFQIQAGLRAGLPHMVMCSQATSIVTDREKWLSSVDAFLRARGTPISVQQLAQQCPRPAALTGRLIRILASDGRFQIQDLGSSAPTVGMRKTPQNSKARTKPPPKRVKSPKTERWAECPTDAPFPALKGKGKWLPSAEVTQRKSFGKFCCFPCRKAWTSAHAYSAPDYQKCEACKRQLPAMWRWQTAPGTERSEEEVERPARDPHKQELCSVCIRKGGPCWY
ncbi:hypothetical protein T484DRAFT_1784858 [Baffinella frigidus]|nr:hypothetical protein T484DRAFT_1784858 [Cryptophyta sp. CCMP2293]